MSRTIIAAIVMAALLIAASPMIVRGVAQFKTFLELSSLLNPCDGAGSPLPCRN